MSVVRTANATPRPMYPPTIVDWSTICGTWISPCHIPTPMLATTAVINLDQAAIWTPMLVLVILMGILHPPTSDDTVELDNTRWTIGILSLAIPVLCFPLLGLKV